MLLVRFSAKWTSESPIRSKIAHKQLSQKRKVSESNVPRSESTPLPVIPDLIRDLAFDLDGGTV